MFLWRLMFFYSCDVSVCTLFDIFNLRSLPIQKKNWGYLIAFTSWYWLMHMIHYFYFPWKEIKPYSSKMKLFCCFLCSLPKQKWTCFCCIIPCCSDSSFFLKYLHLISVSDAYTDVCMRWGYAPPSILQVYGRKKKLNIPVTDTHTWVQVK